MTNIIVASRNFGNAPKITILNKFILFSSTKKQEKITEETERWMEEWKIILDLCCLLGPLELFVAMEGGGFAEGEGRCCIPKDPDGVHCRPRGFWLMDPLGHLSKKFQTQTCCIIHCRYCGCSTEVSEMSRMTECHFIQCTFGSTSYIRHVGAAVWSCTSELTRPSRLAPQTASLKHFTLSQG